VYENFRFFEFKEFAMKPWLLSLALPLTALAALAFPSSAGALVMMLPGPNRVANADTVIVGRVAGIEPQDIVVGSATYRIAVVQVKEAIRGAKDAKTVRVGFVPTPLGKPRIRPGFRGVQLQVGQEGLFLLKKQPKEDFCTLGGPAGYFIASGNNANFDKDLKAVKAIVKVAADPQAGLKSKDADERLLAASVLIDKYRGFRGPGKSKQEPIGAEESKLILLALADADWKIGAGFGSFRPNPVGLFNRLGIGAADGWMPPAGGNPQALMPTWLRDHAETFRVQRFVAAEAK
jgi:hypothetical protein